MLAQNLVPIDDPRKARTILSLVDDLEENDDVQNVFTNFDISEDLMAEVAG